MSYRYHRIISSVCTAQQIFWIPFDFRSVSQWSKVGCIPGDSPSLIPRGFGQFSFPVSPEKSPSPGKIFEAPSLFPWDFPGKMLLFPVLPISQGKNYGAGRSHPSPNLMENTIFRKMIDSVSESSMTGTIFKIQWILEQRSLNFRSPRISAQGKNPKIFEQRKKHFFRKLPFFWPILALAIIFFFTRFTHEKKLQLDFPVQFFR